MSRTFSDFAYERMVELYKHHDKEVGSELKKAEPDKYKDYKTTDCITYVLNVISYAYEKTGKPEISKKVWTLGKHANELAAYLVRNHEWKGVYINPDVNHPLDMDSEHSYSNTLVDRQCSYYDVPISYKVINYYPTPVTDSAYQKLNQYRGATKLNKTDIATLKLIKFGVGFSRGGMHTWLYSNGQVYEVHWNGVGVDLYERSNIDNYQYLSGAIVIPPDNAHLLKVSEVTCG